MIEDWSRSHVLLACIYEQNIQHLLYCMACRKPIRNRCLRVCVGEVAHLAGAFGPM